MVDLAQCKKQYSDAFWKLYGKIRDPIPTEAIRAFQNGLQASRNTALLRTLVHDRLIDIKTLMHIVHEFQMVDSILETEQERKLKSVLVRKEETKQPILLSRPRDPFTRSNAQGEDQCPVMNVDKIPLSELLPILKSKTFY